MKCNKCGFQNEPQANFCSSCGKQFNQAKTPTWIYALLVVLIIATGGVGYGVWEVYQRISQPDSKNITAEATSDDASIEQVVKDITNSIDEKPVDRVTLIRDVQQKVFTVITDYGRGSGFLYAKGGYVVTNAHVVDGEVDVLVRNFNGQEFEAKVIGISESFDIALLHVPDYQNESPLPIESKKSPTGLEVIAFGSPQGFDNTASPGFITGHDRDMEVGRFIYKEIYQVDAQIDKGSSGGALVDATTGKVIGINSLLYTSETSTNFGFSIPLYSMTKYFDEWIQAPMSRDRVLAVAGIYESYDLYEENYDEPSENEIDSVLAGQFVQSFRMYYEQALNESNFSWIADMIIDSAYIELEEYIADISYEGHTFDFLTNDILDVIYENGEYAVNMNETFDFYSASGDYEHFDRYKTYTVVIDQNGAFKISQIKIH
ncbi:MULTISPECIES: trypsin-like peptidase domain-containing protein [unclassified Solibacillus]|uniref:trypsin-like peptidase domain-containing protein n=1 Tax=unclassified Solibacillus TaxID=2637870 RepID=UPI0030F4F05E